MFGGSVDLTTIAQIPIATILGTPFNPIHGAMSIHANIEKTPHSKNKHPKYIIQKIFSIYFQKKARYIFLQINNSNTPANIIMIFIA